MYLELLISFSTGIGSCIYYKKYKDKLYENKNNYDDMELIDDEFDKDCPLIMFDDKGNYYYVYQ